ncbi:scavenger receptor cysteine-rich type 1 protein M160 [Menidia menidia]
MASFHLTSMLFLSEIFHGDPRAGCCCGGGGGPCEGSVELYFNGTAGLVGDKFWGRGTEAVVCRRAQCGAPRPGATQDVQAPPGQRVWLNELRCQGSEVSLWACPGWPGAGLSFYRKTTVKHIQCSDRVRFSLDPYACAGAVQFSAGQKSGYVCGDTWGPEEGGVLCRTLGCGGLRGNLTGSWVSQASFTPTNKMRFDCSGVANATHLWQCVSGEETSCRKPATVICEAHERLQLSGGPSACSGRLETLLSGRWAPFGGSAPNAQNAHNAHNNAHNAHNNAHNASALCRRLHCGDGGNITRANATLLLSCQDDVTTVLTAGVNNATETRCHGAVRVRVNGGSRPVCGAAWTPEDARVVCAELGCGTVVSNTLSPERPAEEGILNHVQCKGSEASLWHCMARRGGQPCSSSPQVICSGSVQLELVDGPGRCAGRLAVRHQGQWRRVSGRSWTRARADAICSHLGCGDSRENRNLEEFGRGSGEFLSMGCGSGSGKITRNITECFANQDKQQRDETPLGLICQEHKVLFLNGSCSGAVGVEQGSATYWLSGSNRTWNRDSAEAVCRWARCGGANGFSSEPNADGKQIWETRQNCSSPLECGGRMEPPANGSQSVAHVTCSGEISVSVTGNCWGAVRVCAGGPCGGVCRDAWTEDKSQMLCEQLGCGGAFLPAYGDPNQRVLFKSLHLTRNAARLSQGSFVDGNNETRCEAVGVVCAGSVKPRFRSSTKKCSGDVQVRYKGRWVPAEVGDLKAQNAVCRELKCGEALKHLEPFGPPTDTVIQLNCTTDSSKLATCSITAKELQTSTPRGLQCSEWRDITLESDRACQGDVVVYSRGERSYVPSHGWTETEAERLCQDLNCGRFKRNSIREKPRTQQQPLWNHHFSCGNKSASIWDCERTAPPANNNTLFFECEKNTTASLSEGCGGEVRVGGVPVCAAGWNTDLANMACQERGCGNALEELREAPPAREALHLRCEQNQHLLGQCQGFRDRCDGGVASISCVGNMKFRSTQKCGGQIEVKFSTRWRKVRASKPDLPLKLKQQLCEEIGCPFTQSEETTAVDIESNLMCPSVYNDFKYCVKDLLSSNDNRPIEVTFCPGYEPARTPPREPTQTRWPLVVIGVGVVLIVLIVAAVFLRSYITNRARRSMLPPGMMLPGEEEEFESGNYEDVLEKSNELEDFGRGRRGSGAGLLRGPDMGSSVSIPYDDVDEAAGGLMKEGALNQSDDGVTYEVEEGQESYDDVDTFPEANRTTAEVHEEGGGRGGGRLGGGEAGGGGEDNPPPGADG